MPGEYILHMTIKSRRFTLSVALNDYCSQGNLLIINNLGNYRNELRRPRFPCACPGYMQQRANQSKRDTDLRNERARTATAMQLGDPEDKFAR